MSYSHQQVRLLICQYSSEIKMLVTQHCTCTRVHKHAQSQVLRLFRFQILILFFSVNCKLQKQGGSIQGGEQAGVPREVMEALHAFPKPFPTHLFHMDVHLYLIISFKNKPVTVLSFKTNSFQKLGVILTTVLLLKAHRSILATFSGSVEETQTLRSYCRPTDSESAF